MAIVDRVFFRATWSAVFAVWSGLTGSLAMAAEAPRFGLPMDCIPGQTCFVQNYVDIDQGPGALDFTCGSLTYDGHKGTDFRILDLVAMARGVTVRAAASGRVLQAHDGVPDGFRKDVGEESLKGRECGNGVVIDHGGGWQTRYCHLRRNSIAVTAGHDVQADEPIAFAGMSGKTDFPHVHFEVRYKTRFVDPFLGPDRPNSCTTKRYPLWAPAVLRALEYRPSGLLNAGFTSDTPSLRGIEEGRYQKTPPGRRSTLIFFVRFFGLRQGDRQVLSITGPDGSVIAERSAKRAEKTMAQWMQFLGRRAPEDGWPRGTYRGEFQLIRNEQTVVRGFRRLELK